jgi:hypothetical protein
MRALKGEKGMSHSVIRLLLSGLAGILLLIPSAVANAPADRYTTTELTVYDTKTKLTWMRTVPTISYTWANAKIYCESPIVSYSFGGSGWHLPTVKELMTLVDYARAMAPLIDPFFTDTPADLFWSATPLASSTGSAWYVSFNDGSVNYTSIITEHNIRCVR